MPSTYDRLQSPERLKEFNDVLFFYETLSV